MARHRLHDHGLPAAKAGAAREGLCPHRRDRRAHGQRPGRQRARPGQRRGGRRGGQGLARHLWRRRGRRPILAPDRGGLRHFGRPAGRALGHRPGGAGRVPSPQEIARARSLSGYERIELDAAASTVRLRDPGMRLDLGGIAKGYAADEVAAILSSGGIRSAIIDLGGNIVVLGSRPKRRQLAHRDPGPRKGAGRVPRHRGGRRQHRRHLRRLRALLREGRCALPSHPRPRHGRARPHRPARRLDRGARGRSTPTPSPLRPLSSASKRVSPSSRACRTPRRSS